MNVYTKNEIFGQPILWERVLKLIHQEKNGLREFLTPILEKENLRIILSGAGSSAFLGEAAQGQVQKNTGRLTQAVSTTDIVTHPESFFLKDVPTLLVSFARSGNSPESLEACSLANEHCDELYQLIITCNASGELLYLFDEGCTNCYSIVLPEEANDKSLAMTGSFTSMLLTILLISNLDFLEEREKDIQLLIKHAKQILEQADIFEELAKTDFKRVVFLGSGPLLGIARECHLKLQELTDGQVICKYDSFLGFRHGPRAVIDQSTLVVYLFSRDEHTLRYELDLARSIAADQRNIHCLTVGEPTFSQLGEKNKTVIQAPGEFGVSIIAATIVGQLLGYYKSLHLGLNPDNPSVSGAISRVVQGVTIYKKENVEG